jgi:hypothetical protein
MAAAFFRNHSEDLLLGDFNKSANLTIKKR